MNEYQGLKIQFDKDLYNESKDIKINGVLSIYVNCGSQYATWFQFPSLIKYTLKNLDSDKTYQSTDNELSISWDGDSVYNEYSKQPCDQIVTKTFSISLEDVYFVDPPKEEVRNFELYGYYAGHKSSSIVFENTPLLLKGF